MIIYGKNCIQKQKKNIIVCLDGDAFEDAKNIYDKLNGGVLYNRIKLAKLPKDKDVCDLKGDITPYYIEEKQWKSVNIHTFIKDTDIYYIWEGS